MRLTLFVCLMFVMSTLAPAQGVRGAGSAPAPNRITGTVNAARTRTISGNVHGLAQAQYDQGDVSPSMVMDEMVLVVKPSTAQQASLDQLLADQQNPGSKSFHQWLTPEEFGDQFGLSPVDLAKVTAWLTSQGLTVTESGRARNWVGFRGTAGQVSQALHTPIRHLLVNGESHYANIGDPAVPEALADVIGGFLGLNDFHLKSQAQVNLVHPDFNSGSSHYLAPQDWATIYNLTPLYSSGLDGTGQNIAVVGESEVLLSDLRAFRTRYNLPANDPVFYPYSGASPGFNDTEAEGDLDLEWTAAIAPKAKVTYVYGTSAISAMTVAINLNIAPIVSISYGGCEVNFRVSFYRSITQQGNAQGITFLNSSGDSGAAGCDFQGSEPVAARGRSVDFPAVLPEVTGVGGTQFAEGSGTYWATANSTNGGSALSYIPEAAWNETTRSAGLLSSGGGNSIYYPRPVWQTGSGVPSDTARHVPDVAFSAAGHDAYTFYSEGGLFAIYGTSASAPSFAGVIALLNQYVVNMQYQAKPGLGNINPQLYRLAQSAPAAFHDTASLDNVVPCQQASPDCLTGSFGYPASPGYDMATGLGSVDASALFNAWNSSSAGVTVSVAATPSRGSLNDSAQLTATVLASGSGAPSGTVEFSSGGIPLGSGVLANGVASVNVPLYLLGNVGTFTITAQYSGDAAFSGGGGTAKVQVVLPTGGAAIIPSAPNTVWPLSDLDAQGLAWVTTINLSEVAGVPAIITGFTIDGVTQNLSSYFPSVDIAASTTISTNVVFRNLAAPLTRTFGFTGVDAAGLNWSRQVAVVYFPLPEADNFSLLATPLVVAQNPAADPSCQWSVQVNADDLGGFQSSLSAMYAGLVPVSGSQIVSTFGTYRHDAFSGLMGTLCFGGSVAPVGSSYVELDRSDGAVQEVQVSFTGPPANPTKLTASPVSVVMNSAAATQSAAATLGVGIADKTQAWTASIFPANRTTSWLTLSQYSGTGPVQLGLSANGAGFGPGAYRAIITLQSPNAVPQYINVPVMFVLGPNTSGMTITSIASGATGLPILAPGMQASVFGSSLANTSATTSGNPLPFISDGVSVTINNLAAPIFYRSPNRLDIQIPYETGAGPAVMTINNNGQIAGFQFQIGIAAPGIFVDSTGTVAGIASVKQGDILVTSVTGLGDVTPGIGTGFASSSSSGTPKPVLPLSVTIGGQPAFVQSAGIPTGSVGGGRISFTVPASVPPGVQPVVVTVGGVSSPVANVTVLSKVQTISGLTPPFAGQGTTTPVILTGTNLSIASSVKFSGSGVTATIQPNPTATQIALLVTVAPDALPGPRSVTVTTSLGTVTAAAAFTVRVTEPVISPVELDSLRSGYAIITPDPASPAPAAAITVGELKGGVVQLQAGAPVGPLTTSVTLLADATGEGDSNFGLAIVNPGSTPNTVTMTLSDSLRPLSVSTITVTLDPQQQLARFWSELFPGAVLGSGFSGSLQLQSSTPFSALGLRFTAVDLSVLIGAHAVTVTRVPARSLSAGPVPNTPAAGTVGGDAAQILPQFTIGGGWATQIALQNSGGMTLTGRVDVFDTAGNPMAVSLNGSVQSTFAYSIAPNGSFLLAPRDPRGASPF